MAFNKKEWTDREVEHPGRRNLMPVDGEEDAFDVERNEGIIFNEGEPFDAANMNDLESRIGQADTAMSQTVANHANNKNNPHETTKEQVGLGNVDNTADANKSVNYAATAGTADKVAANGEALGDLNVRGSISVPAYNGLKLPDGKGGVYEVCTGGTTNDLRFAIKSPTGNDILTGYVAADGSTKGDISGNAATATESNGNTFYIGYTRLVYASGSGGSRLYIEPFRSTPSPATGVVMNGESDSFHPNGASKLDNGMSNYRWKTIFLASNPNVSSDERIKSNIENIDPEFAVRLVAFLDGKHFKLKGGTSGRTHSGHIAQEVEKFLISEGIETKDFAALCIDPKFEEKIVINEDGDEIKEAYPIDGEFEYSLRYEELNIYYQVATKYLLNKYEDLEKRITALEHK